MGGSHATTVVGDALHDPAKARTLCHTWDLARAIGFGEKLDVDAVTRCDAALRAVGNAIRFPGGIAAEVKSSDDASEQTRLPNFNGRVV
jgi:hypothetical protein